jgi:xanthine dehydrogenase accessory factor
MIGSRRRVRATLARLEADGFAGELLDEVHAPLGLDIGAETPEEIADLTLGTKSGRLRRTP